MKKACRYIFVVFLIFFQTISNVSVSFSSEVNTTSRSEEKEDTSAAMNDDETKAFHLFDIVESQNRFIQKMDSFYTVNLPVGIASKDPKKGTKYAIIISDIIIRDGQTFFNAYMAFKIPGSAKKLTFKGSNIPFSYSGGIKGEAKLELISDVEIDISSKFSLKLSGNGATYVSFDCDGFKEMAVEATLEFDSTLFVPENPNGSQKEGKLSTTFKTKVADWNDILISLSLEPFQFKPLKGVGFTITNAVLDLSDSNNSADISFPENYKTDYFADGDENIWRGFYIEKAEIRLPKYFKKKKNDDATKSEKVDTLKSEGSDEDDRLRFYANGMFIDDLGFTAEMGAANLLSLDDGKIGKWAFSLDTINFKIEASQLISANFNGQIKVSEFKNKNIFGYVAEIGLDDSYAFQVSVADSLEMNLWMANIMLEPNSKFNITLENGEFKPALDLNGTITINAPVDKKKPTANKLALAEIPFEGMHIQSEDPYFSIDYISFGTEQNMFSKFPISIDKIKVAFDNGRLGLELALIVNFTKPNAGGFGGKGGFTIWAKRGINSWEYDGIDIDEIAVDISKPDAFELHGKVLFIKGDSVYGDGFKGEIDAKFAKFGMKASALFGSINDVRYWYADALATLATGIPAGPISIYGFGGGAYYNMEQTGVSSDTDSEIGKSSSGIVYRPTKSGVVGIIASVKLGMTSAKNSFNGDVKLEMTFNSTGGINKLYFTGNGYFMTGNFSLSGSGIMDKAKGFIGKSASGKITKDENNAQISGTINMEYDFNNTSYYSTLDLYVNVANGKITGNYAENRAGSGVISINPSDWYIKLGTPQSPNEISVAGLATMSNYFMAGKTIPEMPAPPDNVVNGLGSRISDYYNQRNSSAVPEGTGFALGAKLNYSTGDKQCWIFYGKFDCLLGFDMLLKNYGSLSVCSNTNELVGINGWYAQGQAYGWISGNVSMDVDVLVYKGRCTIFEANLAALLNAKAPNPSWMMGNVAGNYNILGGIITGNFSFDFEIGQQCDIVAKGEEPVKKLSMISSINPGNNQSEVDVFSSPQVILNMPAEKQFEIRDEQNVAYYYRIKLNKFEVKDQDGNVIEGTQSWNSEKKIATFKPNNILPGRKNLTIKAEVAFEKKSGTSWVTVSESNNPITETRQLTFTTANTPNSISTENVAVSYPQVSQFNYYKSEPGNNFIKLKIGQPLLFNPGSNYEQKVKITATSTNYSKYISFTYDQTSNKISFSLPTDLPVNTVMTMKLMNVPVASASNSAQITSPQVSTQTKKGGGKGGRSIKPAESPKPVLKETEFFSMNFRTSKYGTFPEKINSLNFSKYVRNEDCLTSSINGERFDSYEIENLSAYKQVTTNILLNDTSWYTSVFLPSVSFNQQVLSRLHSSAFNCPDDVININIPNGTRILRDDEIQAGSTEETDSRTEIRNYLLKYLTEYYNHLQTEIAKINRNAGWYKNLDAATKQKMNKILVTEFVIPTNGKFPVNFHYTLPTGVSPNSNLKKNLEYTE